MRYIALALITCFIASTAFAQQHRIQDLSLSPEETAREPNNIRQNNTRPLNNQTQNQGMFPASPNMPNQNYNPVVPTQTNRFMDGYCDPNFHPALAASQHYAGMESCLQKQKDQSCAQFQALPADAQSVLDATIGCLFSSDSLEPQDGQPSAGCTGNDTGRLQLLKKYWRDQNTSYALVFLPDAVLNDSSNCMRGGR